MIRVPKITIPACTGNIIEEMSKDNNPFILMPLIFMLAAMNMAAILTY
ncbi:hypothetical protein ECSTECEH250_2615 [Escherichia coli STEC_EH250]|nr:hypothetical protein ECSTECEH250_2615 [Escherichia coli STEC_EH250]